jgi:PAS domain S-box-containing protein
MQALTGFAHLGGKPEDRMSAAREGEPLSPAAAAVAAFVADSPLNIIMLDRDGRIVECSPTVFATAGVTREQFVGTLIQDLFQSNTARLREALGSGDLATPIDVPLQSVQMPNGEVHWIQTTLSPWREADGAIGGLVCVNSSMTFQQRTQAELSRTKALLDAVVESIPSMVSVRDAETGQLVRMNRAAEAFLGFSREEMANRPPPVELGEAAMAKHEARIEAALAGVGAESEEEGFYDRNGELRTLYARRQLITDERGVKHLLTVSEDVTDRRRVEAELQGALRAAEAANQAKSAFLATMSHEIRTPLNGVLGMAQAMARDELPTRQRERLEVIRQSGEALLTLLNDILDLSKVEAGKLELEVIDFDLPQALQGAAAGFAAIAAAKDLGLVVDAAAAQGACRGDPARLRQVVGNLISNAVKFTETGEVRVSARRTGETVAISISDTGAGIAPDVLPRLFDKFVQADSSTTRRFGGTGLGLAICRELAQAMGGTVVAQSSLGQGACFTLTLPLPPADAPVGTAADQETSLSADLRILAAEDNPVNQQVLRTIFEQVGLPITIVADGGQAVAAYRDRDWDIILMDMQMPVLDGRDATRAIRQIEYETGRRRAHVIALTANAMEHQKAEYLACGVDRLVAKPLQINDLFNAINACTNAEVPAEAVPRRASGGRSR